MGGATLTIKNVRAHAVIAPLARPLRNAIGTIPASPLVLIDVETHQGIVGHAYIFGYTPLTLAPLVQLVESIGAEIAGKPVAPAERMRDLDWRFRLLGWQGLVGMAVSGLDMASWDALGQAAGLPVAVLLGGNPTPLRAYDSYGLVDPTADEKVLLASVANKFRGIKIKLGDGTLAEDAETVRLVRAMIGADVALMVDFNQSLDPPEAIRRIGAIAKHDIAWAEEPVRADDLAGHARVRAAVSVPIQTGENWWFPRGMADALAVSACDFAMPDLMKIGGVTGWLSAMGQAEAASMPMSSHIFPEASAHVMAATPTAHWVEYLDIAGAVLKTPCEVVDGMVTPAGPGLGLAWDAAAMKRYAA